MYPRNAASPERVSIGAVVQISDGAVQTSGVSVKVIPFGGTEASGGGTVAYSADGAVLYTPTQAETNYTSFILVAVKTGCVPATLTVVTTASSTAGKTVVASIDNNAITAAVIATDAIGAAEIAADAVTKIQNGLATPTNITAGTITTVTNLTNLPNIPNNWMTAAGIAAGALNGKGDWNIGKTGYALSASGVQAIWDALTSALTTAGSIGKFFVDRIVGTIASGTHNPQSGDAFARLGAPAGASIAVDIATEATRIIAIKAVTDKLDTAMELDGLVYRFTINALEQAPSGGGGGSTDWTADERTAIRTILGVPTSGTTPEVPSAGALKVIDDLIDTEISSLATAVADVPTVAEFEARTIVAASYATATELAKVIKTGEEFTATDGTGTKDVTFTRI